MCSGTSILADEPTTKKARRLSGFLCLCLLASFDRTVPIERLQSARMANRD